MIATATEIATALAEKEIAKGLQRMKLTLNHEIDRLTALQKMNKDIRPDEIQRAMDELTSLSTVIKKARIRLDALQLIRKE
jgi:ATP-dependent helicase HepA